MTTLAATRPAVRVRHSAATELLFLATLFSVTFAKLHWNVAGDVSLADVLTMFFLVAFASERLGAGETRLPATAVSVLAFAALFLLVYLTGWFNLETTQALTQWGKGMVKFALHFLFLAAGIAYLVERSERAYWRALAAFAAGLGANAAYGVLQLLAARAGVNLDLLLLSPITGGASQINVYGAVAGERVYRTNALTGDPNHLGIMLLVPLLVLLPLYLRLERGHRLKLPLAGFLGFLALVFLSTLSRSAMLGLAVGLLVLALPYRRYVGTRALLVPAAALAALVGWLVWRRLEFFTVVFRSRIQTGDRATAAHFGVYELIPDVLATNPLFGLGLNNFSVYYEFVTGRTNWGPHSFYVALLVETGIVGAVLFGVFLWWVFRRIRLARAVGRALDAAAAARVRPLAWGLTAALAATLVANLFYLTMIFYYFYAFLVLALAAAPVFRRRLAAARV